MAYFFLLPVLVPVLLCAVIWACHCGPFSFAAMRFPEAIALQHVAAACGATIYSPEASVDAHAQDYPVLGLNEIHKVKHGDLTFADHPKYTALALKSAATVLLFNKVPVDAEGNDLPLPVGKHILLHPAPFDAYNVLVLHFFPELLPDANYRHPNIEIPSSSHVGERCRIGPGVFIGEHVSIGDDCVVGPNAVLMPYTHLGNRVRIGAGSVLGGDAFYYKRKPEGWTRLQSCGRTILEDDVEIGNNCTIDRGVSGDTIIGRGSKVDNLVHLGHGVVMGAHCLIAAQVGIGGKTTLEDEVVLWGQVGVQKDILIGRGAVVLGKGGVTKSIPGGRTYSGNPAVDNRVRLRQMAQLARMTRVKSDSLPRDDNSISG